MSEVIYIKEESEPDISFWNSLKNKVKVFENSLIAIILGFMIFMPLLEILLRKVFRSGLSGSSVIEQNLTLLVGMLGGAIAAREARLLSLSALPTVLKGKWKAIASIVSAVGACVISVYLCFAGIQFVLSEKEAGSILAYGFRSWIVQAALPLGFAVIVWRLIYHSHEKWWGRLTVAIITIAIALLLWKLPLNPAKMILPCLGLLLVATILGAPVYITLGGSAMILFWGADVPIAAIPIDHYRMVTNPSLPMIPLFTLAGYFLAEGGASKRLVRVFMALVGQIRGGPAVVASLACAFFTTFTGASGVTILALGGLLMPVLIAARYSDRNSLGFITSAGALGMLFPPCLPLILYAIIAKNITIEQMFLGGIIPGILMVGGTIWLGIYLGPKITEKHKVFDWQEIRASSWDAKWELLVPVVALASLFSGIATAIEASAITAFYTFFIETFVYKDLKLTKDVPRVMADCGLLVGGVLLILGVALSFTNYLVDAQVAAKGVEWVSKTIHSPYVFLIVLNVFLLIVGCLMDVYSAIIVVVPLLTPIGSVFGIDPVHLGVIFLANLELGFLTPPVGMNLFLASYRFNKPMSEVTRSILPMLAVRLVCVLLITYIPFLSTALPKYLGK